MKLPNFYEFEPLNTVKSKMGIPRNVYGTFTVLVDASRLTKVELEKLTSANGLDISADELTILPDGTLAYKNSRVILYIRDITVYGNKEIQPKFHLADCITLQQMREQKRFDRYVVSTRTDGLFNLNVINDGQSRVELQDLSVCQNCLNFLHFNKFEMKWSKSIRFDFVRLFKIDNFFDQFPRSIYQNTPKYNSDNAPLNIYADNFDEISQKVRSASEWCCQKCGNDLSAPENRKWLHAHHINGLKYDNNKENLAAICIGCHAKEFNHEHIKNTPDYYDYLTRNT